MLDFHRQHQLFAVHRGSIDEKQYYAKQRSELPARAGSVHDHRCRSALGLIARRSIFDSRFPGCHMCFAVTMASEKASANVPGPAAGHCRRDDDFHVCSGNRGSVNRRLRT